MSMGRRIPAFSAALAVWLGTGALAASAGSLIEVELDNPELRQMRATQGAAARTALGPTEGSRYDKLKLPLMIPDPAATARAIGASVAPKPTIMIDDEEPVWYHSETDLGGVQVSVEADLRVQHEFPESYPVYGEKAPGAAPEPPPPLHAGHVDEGMANKVGQVTVTRYNVPYTITVTCENPDSDKCKMAEKMAQDASILKLIGAPKP